MAKIAIGIVAVLMGAAATAYFIGLPAGFASSLAKGVSAKIGMAGPAASPPPPAVLLAQAKDAAESTGSPQPSSTLPGGATSLRESYQDWTVVCAQRQVSGDDQGAGRRCAMNQQQFDSQSRQRILAMELTSGPNGLEGVLVLPFGLDLDRGVTLQTDDSAPGPILRFRTCLPAGCIVPIKVDPKQAAVLGKGDGLKVKAVADGGADALFRISLKGFGSAEGRLAALR